MVALRVSLAGQGEGAWASGGVGMGFGAPACCGMRGGRRRAQGSPDTLACYPPWCCQIRKSHIDIEPGLENKASFASGSSFSAICHAEISTVLALLCKRAAGEGCEGGVSIPQAGGVTVMPGDLSRHGLSGFIVLKRTCSPQRWLWVVLPSLFLSCCGVMLFEGGSWRRQLNGRKFGAGAAPGSDGEDNPGHCTGRSLLPRPSIANVPIY